MKQFNKVKEEKKTNGYLSTILFAYLEIIMGLLGFLWLYISHMRLQQVPGDLPMAVGQLLSIIMIPYFIMLGVLTLKLKPIGRLLNLFFSPITSFFIWISLFMPRGGGLFPFSIDFLNTPVFTLISGSGLIIFFFTRPKIKEQFKK